jgi:hypothetical protein
MDSDLTFEEMPEEYKQLFEQTDMEMFVEAIFRSFKHPITFFCLTPAAESGYWGAVSGEPNLDADLVHFCVTTTSDSTPESVATSLWKKWNSMSIQEKNAAREAQKKWLANA